MKRDSFVLYTKINEVVKELNNEQKGILFQAILDYEEVGEVPELDQLLKLVFIPIKQDLDKNNEKWESQSKSRSEAGKKGMASRYNKDVKEVSKEKSVTTEPNEKKDIGPNKGESVAIESNTVSETITEDSEEETVEVHTNKTNTVRGVITNDNAVITNLTNVTDNVYVYDYVNDNVINTPPISPSKEGEGEGVDSPEAMFDEFWRHYPKKQGKGVALKAWNKIKLTGELYAKILSSVDDNVKHNKQWQRDNGRYIPYPATWLNQTRWLDEIPIPLNEPPEEQGESSGYSQELLDRLAGVIDG